MNDWRVSMGRITLTALAILMLAACGATPAGNGGGGDGNGGNGSSGTIDYAPESPPLHDTIAYVPLSGDEIRLINPDGSSDRRLWAHGLADPEGTYDIWSMAWNRSATRLAFSSTHENWCSLFTSDIFHVGADGSGYSRATQAPACGQLANFPQGTVQIPVSNASIYESFSGFMYFQGATSIQPLNLAPGGSGMVSFPSVADFGDGEEWLQVATMIVPPNREIVFSTASDVQQDSTVTTSDASVYTPGAYWETRSPTWSSDGSEIGFIYNFNGFTRLPVEPGPLEFGTSLLAEGDFMPLYTDHLSWGPTAQRAGQLLYFGSDSLGGVAGIYLMSEGSNTPGERLVTLSDTSETVLDLAWLPDGSGFVFTVTGGEYYPDTRGADIYLFEFAGPGLTPLTDLHPTGEYAGRLSVSGDGQKVVFELSGDIAEAGFDLVDPDLWILDIASATAELLMTAARAPAWSW